VLIPPVRLVRAGVLVQDIVDILLAASRLPVSAHGDLHAHLAALDLGGGPDGGAAGRVRGGGGARDVCRTDRAGGGDDPRRNSCLAGWQLGAGGFPRQ